MNKTYHVILITLCIIPVLLFSMISVFDADKEISERENRALTQKPPLSLNNYLSGDFSSDFESYYSDNFPLREFFLDFSNKVTTFKGFDSPDGVEIIITDRPVDLGEGENDLPGWNNFPEDTPSPIPESSPGGPSTPGTHNPSGGTSATPSNTPPKTPAPSLDNDGVENFTSIIIYNNRAMELFYYRESRLQYYIDMANRLQSKLPDCQIYSLIAPTSTEFYSPEKYHSLSQSQKDAISFVYSKLNSNIKTVDAYDEISRHTNEYIYFKTDHHWTARGAYYAYRAFAKTAGLDPVPMEKYSKDRIDNFLGSFYRSTQSEKLKKNPDYVELFMPFTEHKGEIFQDINMVNPYPIKAVRNKISSSNKYIAFSGGDSPLTVFKTEVKNGKKILVLKESFGNAFIPFLLPHYEEIYVIDPRQLQTDLIKFINDHKIKDIILINYTIAAGNQKYVNLINNMIMD